VSNPTDDTHARGDALTYLIDAPLGIAVGAARIAGRATDASVAFVRPIVGVALRPPLLPRRLWPQTAIEKLADRGAVARHDLERKVSDLADALVPDAVSALLERTDLAGIAHKVIDDIDLPLIIRESSSTVASESVIGVRLQGIYADDKVGRVVDRLLLRRNGRNTVAITEIPRQ